MRVADGYRVFYGTTSTTLDQSVLVSGAAATSQVINGLAPGIYYFTVATINSAGAASGPSNSVARTVP